MENDVLVHEFLRFIVILNFDDATLILILYSLDDSSIVLLITFALILGPECECWIYYMEDIFTRKLIRFFLFLFIFSWRYCKQRLIPNWCLYLCNTFVSLFDARLSCRNLMSMHSFYVTIFFVFRNHFLDIIYIYSSRCSLFSRLLWFKGLP